MSLPDFDSLEKNLLEAMQAAHVPGLALAFLSDDSITYAKGFGRASSEEETPVRPETLFRIASLTKPLTAALILRLVEAEHLDLDTPIGAYLPDVTYSNPGYGEKITLRHLLSHSAGLPSSYSPYGSRDPEGLARFIHDTLPTAHFLAPPGLLYSYSNLGFRLAGYIAEQVMKTPYADLMQAWVFNPLAMSRTTFDTTVAMTYPIAQAHDTNAQGQIRVIHRYSDNAGGYPSGGAISNVLDFAHFMLMLLGEGGFRGQPFLSRESLALMRTPQVDRFTPAGGAYGLGLRIDGEGTSRRLGHDGLTVTFGSRFMLWARYGVVIFCNRATAFWPYLDALTEKIIAATGQHSVTSLPQPVTQPIWVEGAFLGDERGYARLYQTGEGYFMDWNGENIALTPTRQNLFSGQKADGTAVHVGMVNEQYIQINSAPCGRISPFPAFTPGDLAAFVGTYQGADKLIITAENGILYAYSLEYDVRLPCLPLSQDVFACDFGLLEFQGKRLLFSRVYPLTRVNQ